MSTQHTPGPWEVRIPFSTAALHSAYIIAGNSIIASMRNGVTYSDAKTARANANLIAAAPDLLEALRLCHEQLQRHDGESAGWHEANDATLAAIAKANRSAA